MSEFTYKSPASRMVFFKQMVIFSLLGSVLVIATQLMIIGFVQENFAAAFLSRGAFGEFIMLEALAYGALAVYFAGFLGVVISSLMLIHRLTANAHAMGSPTENSPAWGVGWWFVPFANLFKPYQHLKDLMVRTGQAAADIAHLRRVMLIWWLGWVIYNIGTSITDRMFGDPQGVSDVVQTATITSIQEVIGIAVLCGYFYVLRGLTHIQTERSRVVDVF